MNKTRKRNIIILIALLLGLILSLLLIFLGISRFYKGRIAINTWANGYYISGLTIDEACEILAKDNVVPEFTLSMGQDEKVSFDFSSIEYNYDYRTKLSELVAISDGYDWLSQLSTKKVYEINPVFTYSSDDVLTQYSAIDIVEAEECFVPEVSIDYCDDHQVYEIENNLNNHLDTDSLLSDINDAISNQVSELDSCDASYYYDYEPDSQMSEDLALFDFLEKYQNCDLVYDMGAEEIRFDSGKVLDFYIYDGDYPVIEDGRPVLDDERIVEFVTALCEEYNTLGKNREFLATRGETVTVLAGNYGTEIDYDAELSFLRENLLNEEYFDGIEDRHIPTYSTEAYARGKNDIGGTYIEVDITNQKLYFYKDYVLTLESDVVTGNESEHRSTIKGVYYIYNLETERALVGADYVSYVHYWIPFCRGYGLHDATWRSAFGGDIYLTAGSHGCVNLPLDFVGELYEYLEIGMPVVVFY